MTKHLQGMGRPLGLLGKLRRLLRRDRGVAIVDFALMAPLLVGLTMGGIEIGRYALLNQKLSRVATNTSDLVSQAEFLTEDDMDQVFIASEFSLRPFQLGADGLVIITSVSTDDNPNNPTINWQRMGGGSLSVTSSVGNAGGPATMPNGYEMKANRNVIVTEVYYDYEPFFFEGVTTPRQLEHYSIYRPRIGVLTQILPSP